MGSPSLTVDVLRYQKTGSGLPELLERIGLIVYRYPARHARWDEDQCSDFFCYFFPKVPGLIRRFTYQGRPFEVYLIACIRWRLKTYAKSMAHSAARYRATREPSFWPHLVRESSTEYTHSHITEHAPNASVSEHASRMFKVEEDGVIRDPVSKRRVLFLLLKTALEIDDEMIEKVVRLTGIDRDWTFCKIQELKACMSDRLSRLELLRGRRNHAFYRIHYLKERLGVEVEESKIAELTSCLLQEEAHLRRAIATISKIPMAPTHRDIASVLGIPKGSVDSALYYIRNLFTEGRASGVTRSSPPRDRNKRVMLHGKN